MSELSSLADLANFVGHSNLTQTDANPGQRALKALSARLMAKPQRRSVGELLAVVLVMSARTRRVVMPPVHLELDVFAPSGQRAVRVFMGPRR